MLECRAKPDVSEPLMAETRGLGILRFFAAAAGGDIVCRHSLAVARHALTLAKALAVQEVEFLRDLKAGALLHDIGKIGMPKRILKKRGPLTGLEREIIREHPWQGYQLISRLEYLREAGLIVLYHHERFDGLGYPFGLARNAIPLAARIFSLVDALDAMTSDRPYRSGRSFQDARREIVRCRGTQFDPDVVDAFLSVPVLTWLTPPEKPWPVRGSPLIH
ncbi:MAG: hypothetical protein A2Y86_04115 [Candidatus Aminicenantes bacterium RBG_13_62_12]|nr:MAG: hypothetical protein A2Y86_04115 [Candidatus Aminicenantes bacterium RBG_13_62_12]